MKMLFINEQKTYIMFAFNGQHYKSCQALMQSIVPDPSRPGKSTRYAQWDNSIRMWKKPYTPELLKSLSTKGWKLMGDADFVSKEIEAKKEDFTKVKVNYDKSLLPEKIRNYQITAVEFALSGKGKALIGAPCGSGKSLMSSTLVKILTGGKGTVIVCPAGLKTKWQTEIRMWTGLDSVVLSGEKVTGHYNPKVIHIINYDILRFWTRWFSNDVRMVVADEAHNLANATAKWTESFMARFSRMDHMIFLSGTPAKSKTRELYNMLHMLAPSTFNSEQAFLKRYCDPKPGPRGITYDGISNAEELHNLIKPLMIRFKKEDILPDLPEKQYVKRLLDAESVDYQKAEAEYKAMVKKYGQGAPECKKSYELLSKSAYAEKRKYLIDMIDTILEEGEKLVVGAWHHTVIDDLIKHFPDALVMDGRVPSGERQAIEDAFQNDPKKRLLIGQLKASGEGFDFTAANKMLFAELWYIPSVVHQFMERIHRITSKGDTVTYYFPVVSGSVDETIVDTLDERVNNLSLALDSVSGDKFFKE